MDMVKKASMGWGTWLQVTNLSPKAPINSWDYQTISWL